MHYKTTLISKPLQTERLPNGSRKLLRDLVVGVDGVEITVPRDTITDYSSIPWFARWFVRWSKVDIAGVVHDWLYAKGEYERCRSDKIWRMVAVAGEHRATHFQAWVCWLVLRLFGSFAWNKHREKRFP